MRRKRIYTCLQNFSNGNVEINVTDENGHPIVTSVFDNRDETIAYFEELKDEFAGNREFEINEIDAFHFECQKLEFSRVFRIKKASPKTSDAFF